MEQNKNKEKKNESMRQMVIGEGRLSVVTVFQLPTISLLAVNHCFSRCWRVSRIIISLNKSVYGDDDDGDGDGDVHKE